MSRMMAGFVRLKILEICVVREEEVFTKDLTLRWSQILCGSRVMVL